MRLLDFQPKLFSLFKDYNKAKFTKDVMAGIIVGVVALPLAIAFGIASGVSPEEGLITAIIGGFIVSFLGGSSVQIGGPTGAFVVIVYGVIAKFGIEGLAIATLMAGVILVIMGFARLGTVIRFIPYPIIVGFTAGIAVIIFTSQIGDLLGLSLTDQPAEFLPQWGLYATNLSKVNFPSLAVGVGTILLILLSTRVIKKVPGSLLAIVVMTLICYLLREIGGITSIETIGDRYTIAASLPKIRFYSVNLDLLRQLFPAAFTIALLGAIESLLSATVADGVTGDKHHSNTELVAQGVANIVAPFFGGIPVTGAIARTMTNINNGGRSPISGLVHAVVLLLILLFLGKLALLIPLPCLAGILVMVAYNMSQWRTFRAIFSHPKSDVAVLLVTFFLTVFLDLTIAIEVGMLLALVLFMRRVSKVSRISLSTSKLDLSKESEITQEITQLNIPKGVEVYEIEGPFFFGIAQKLDELSHFSNKTIHVRIFRMRRVPFMDSTGIYNLSSLIKQCKSRGIHVILSGVTEYVKQLLQQGGITEEIGAANICNNIHDSLIKTADYLPIHDEENDSEGTEKESADDTLKINQ